MIKEPPAPLRPLSSDVEPLFGGTLTVSESVFKAFLAELDGAPRDNSRLRATMQRKAPWE
jgi:hypothetical protein